MPSHSWPVGVLPETLSKSLCSIMIPSLLPQRNSRRFIEVRLVARPKGVGHDRNENRDEDRRPEGRDEIRCNILDRQDGFHRSAFSARIYSAKIGFFVDEFDDVQ